MSSSSTSSSGPSSSSPTSSSSLNSSASANYFLGFIVIFTVLLLIAIGCGLASRRALLARRRAAQTYLDDSPWQVVGGRSRRPRWAEQPIPRFWEAWIANEKPQSVAQDWSALEKPISVSYLVTQSPRTTTLSQTPRRLPRPLRRISYYFLLPFSSPTFQNARSLRSSQPPPSPSPPASPALDLSAIPTFSLAPADGEDALQIAVMVAMPTSPRTLHPPSPFDASLGPHTQSLPDELAEYQIGVAVVPLAVSEKDD